MHAGGHLRWWRHLVCDIKRVWIEFGENELTIHKADLMFNYYVRVVG